MISIVRAWYFSEVGKDVKYIKNVDCSKYLLHIFANIIGKCKCKANGVDNHSGSYTSSSSNS